MNVQKFYRRRLIPDECILLKDDIIVKSTDEVIVTSWKTLNPKTAFSHGASCFFLKEGIKVSKFYRADGQLYHMYCDIVDYDYNEAENALTAIDLLADVIISPDGFVKVVDLDELVEALDKNLISADTMKSVLLRVNKLLTTIYEGRFAELTAEMDTLNL
ncbi:MAG: DUF402 domain-containing protein [Lachnospiraceae bacterium]|nr:DUF402 domain-containing protein [Lachnospiraceae bacterium]